MPSGSIQAATRIQALTMTTPIGPLALLARDGTVLAGGFTDDLGALVNGRLRALVSGAHRECVASLGPISDALKAYFAGEVSALDRIPVAYTGAPFQQRVWEALRTIAPGQPTTYKALALRFGNPKLARAVGMGCATNLISPIIPCHRVTHGTGHLAGYAWTLDRKRWLLDHERRHAGP